MKCFLLRQKTGIRKTHSVNKIRKAPCSSLTCNGSIVVSWLTSDVYKPSSSFLCTAWRSQTTLLLFRLSASEKASHWVRDHKRMCKPRGTSEPKHPFSSLNLLPSLWLSSWAAPQIQNADLAFYLIEKILKTGTEIRPSHDHSPHSQSIAAGSHTSSGFYSSFGISNCKMYKTTHKNSY